MTLLEHFQQVLASTDSKLAFARALACPALLWDASASALRRWINTQPASEQAGLTAQLAALQRLGASLAENLGQWPAEAGPIEQLADRVAAGELTLTQALAIAPTVAPCLAPPYVRVVADRCRLRAINGDWQRAVEQFRLLLAAADALGDDAAGADMRRTAAFHWIETVAAACLAVPDGRLFHDAVKRGEALLAQWDDPADVMHRLGVLHLDPYVSGRNSRRFTSEIQVWFARLADTYGPMVASDPAAAMPEPTEAIARAIDWFNRALAHRRDEARGLTLKALAEALVWREIAGGPADRDAARKAAHEALGLLPPARNAAHVQSLRGLLGFLEPDAAKAGDGDAPAVPGQERLSADLLWLDPSDVADRHGEAEARQRYLLQARTLIEDDPHTAIALMLRLWPTLVGPRAETSRRSAVEILARALMRAAGAPDVLRQAGDDRDRLRPSLAAAASEGDWTRGRRAAALAGLAAALTADSREADGLDLIGQALEVAGEALPALVAPLSVLRADLTLGEAVNAYDARRWDDATRHYLDAVGLYDVADMPETAINALVRAEDVTFADADRSPAALAVALASHAAPLAARGAPRLADRLQRMWDRVLARIGEQSPVNPILLWLALQGAKGAAFAFMLRHVPYDWRQDAEAAGLLARIAALRAESPPQATIEEDPLGDSLILVGHAGSDADGNDAAYDPAETLERHFDGLLARRMTGGEISEATYPLGEDLASLVGPRSVLMSLHLGRSQDGRLAVTTALLAGDDNALSRGIIAGTPWGLVSMQGRRHAVEMSMFGPVVAGLRDNLQRAPWPETIDPEAAATLASDHAMLLGGGMATRLAEMMAAGRDHLCIHPHGPYHFHPLHLIGPAGHPLADDWIVTTVPHPALLRPRGEADLPRRDLAVAALGLDFAGGQPHGMAELPGAALEAQTVASILGGRAYVNANATRARFFEAIAGARRVHVATHGAHDVSAPAFQRLYLHPDAGSDGIVYAYEIVGLDLRHLDLMTLSACETALGRSDISDTLRGLPAALFVAGVATIVSTLWPVANQPACLFFETLYGELAKQVGKLDAFRAAQRAVRAAWPEWRDWGTFHYAGRW